MDAIDTEVLISEVQSTPMLWNPGKEDYKNRGLRNKAWEEICSSIIPIFDEADDNLKKKLVEKVRSRWKSSRDSYMKAKGKAKVLKSGSPPCKPIKYVYYEQIHFLDKVQQRSTISNFETQAVEDENISEVFDDNREINEDNDIHDDASVAQDAARREFSESVKITEKKKQKLDDLGENLLALLKSSKETEEDSDRSFLLSLLPHVRGFDEEQKLIFQSGVLQMIMKIKQDYAPTTPIASHASYLQYHSYNPGPSQMIYNHPQQSSPSVSDPGPSQTNYINSHSQSVSTCQEKFATSWESGSTV
ncbi:uncharacterized protein LOC111868852 isoform X2 [Cryptotermes secundus]|uniref:uncharacterized protein LOC111868852 isoform X2 n=1 Tax=Cryptotermes secundus TaxID=105785 RepID=UPI001454C175|nr:uncharacterized protein LOC111868852 isoform X2 [Cryptotermes secundus]